MNANPRCTRRCARRAYPGPNAPAGSACSRTTLARRPDRPCAGRARQASRVTRPAPA
jgi:hypothetical protein